MNCAVRKSIFSSVPKNTAVVDAGVGQPAGTATIGPDCTFGTEISGGLCTGTETSGPSPVSSPLAATVVVVAGVVSPGRSARRWLPVVVRRGVVRAPLAAAGDNDTRTGDRRGRADQHPPCCSHGPSR